MTTHAYRLILLMGAICLISNTVLSAEVYQLIDFPALQNGIALSGTINAVDANHNLVLDPAELTSWSLTIDGDTSTSADPLAGSLLTNVSIANGQIFLEDAAKSGVGEQFILAIALEEFVNYSNGAHSGGFNDQIYNGRAGSVPSPSWLAETVPTNGPNLAMSVPDGRMVIATRVPEPGTLPLFVIASLGLARLGHRQRKASM